MNRHVTRRLLVRLGSAILVWSSFGMVSEAGEDGVRRLQLQQWRRLKLKNRFTFIAKT